MRLLRLVTVLVVLVAACGSDSEDARVLTEDEHTTEVLVDAGEEFEVRLESNPSTGFAWVIAGDPTVVELRNRRFEEPESDLVGAPGTDVFSFEAIGDAEILRFEYLRSSDDPPIPERIIELIIRVDDAPWPPADAQPPATSSAVAPVEIADVLSGDPGDVSVIGYVVIDDAGSRLCEVLAESFPPQCGGSSITITNPDALTVALEEEQTVKWSNERVRLDGTYDGAELTLEG